MALDIDRFAHLESLLQRWDPRTKILSLMLFIVAVALLHSIALATCALLIALGLLRITRIPRAFVASGVTWVVLFLIPFLLIMPATYPGEPDTHLLGVPFAWPGFRLAILIVIKALTIVLTSYVIFGTTRFDISMMALQHLKCPAVFVQMLLFTYRYIFVFVEEMRRMDTAMKARGFVAKPNMNTLRISGNFVGTLLIRSFERTDRIYKAMLSKGYRGEFHSLTTFSFTSYDALKAAITIAVALLLFGINQMALFTPAEQGWL